MHNSISYSTNQTYKNLYNEIIEDSNTLINKILNDKYLYNFESNYYDLVERITNSVKEEYIKRNYDINQLKRLLIEKKFLPAGSILYKLGTDRKSSLSNCYYIDFKNDSLESIFDTLGKAARIYSWRGGVGLNLTTLRPKGALLNNAAKFSTGSVSFAPLISHTTEIIGQDGRRGACIITLNIRHPDIIDFIKSKSSPKEVFNIDKFTGHVPNIDNANISVLITDEFMKKVENDEEIELIFPDFEKEKDFYNENWNGDYTEYEKLGGKFKTYQTVRARDLFKLIASESWKIGDPGVIFWDNVINETFMSLSPITKPKGLNPCGEQILPNYGNCLLLASNLSAYVKNPWSNNAYFDKDSYYKDIKEILKFGDILVDINKHPLKEQNELSKMDRKIGYETTGLADCLAMLNLKYDSEEALNFVNDLYKHKAYYEFLYEVEMAKELGACPILKDNKKSKDIKENMLKFNPIKSIVENFSDIDDLINDFKKYGVRNFGWSTQGPCGSLSVILNNCTSGIEPLFRFEYYRETRLIPDKKIKIVHPPLLKFLYDNNKLNEIDELSKEELIEKYSYVESDKIDYMSRIKMQSIIQKWITDSISSTINLPEDTDISVIENIYFQSWKLGLKGITIFRNNCKKSVFTEIKDETDNTSKNKEVKPNITYSHEGDIYNVTDLYQKEKIGQPSRTHTVNWKNINVYITVVEDQFGNPKKVFSSIPHEAGLNGEGDVFRYDLLSERTSYWTTICRLISTCLKNGIKVDKIVKQLRKSSFNITHIPAHLARILSIYDEDKTLDMNLLCPSCGKNTLIIEQGCNRCLSCGYSKC